MRSAGVELCEVCKEELVKDCYFRVNLVENPKPAVPTWQVIERTQSQPLLGSRAFTNTKAVTNPVSLFIF